MNDLQIPLVSNTSQKYADHPIQQLLYIILIQHLLILNMMLYKRLRVFLYKQPQKTLQNLVRQQVLVAILFDAVQIYGNRNCDVIAALTISLRLLNKFTNDYDIFEIPSTVSNRKLNNEIQ
ncbi:Hypothetical_protein [Hexamita inflata]|uniref:Hypothetical_protein n=1 Tax=Hexamita inflata TaxID=28002 RepID=A0ABP1HL77_9EUKA